MYNVLFDCFHSESRYLLILTENYAALTLLQHKLAAMGDAVTIFGSSFRKDQQFTQVSSMCGVFIYFLPVLLTVQLHQ